MTLWLKIFSIVISLLWLDINISVAADTDNDTDHKPNCKYCPDREPVTAAVELGLAISSEESLKFNEYRGTDQSGVILRLDGELNLSNDRADYLWLNMQNLATGAREITLEGGRQGSYRIDFDYNEITHLQNIAKTPYLGVGSQNLRLPTTWQTSDKVSELSNLNNSLSNVDIKQERQRVAVAGTQYFGKRWQAKLAFHQETKEGLSSTGTALGSAYNNAMSVILPEPIDYVTRQLHASVNYSGQQLQSEFGYRGSFFNNKQDFLKWDNAFSNIINNPAIDPDQAQLALPPDNQHHRFYARVGLQTIMNTRVRLHINVGRMTQDQTLLPYSVNANNTALSTSLPVQSADAQADTLSFNLRLTNTLIKKLKLNGSIAYNERNNKTPRVQFDYVKLDYVNGPSVTNRPYRFRHGVAKLAGAYRLSTHTKADLGYRYDLTHRTYQDTNQTTEHQLFLKTRSQLNDNISAHAQYTFSKRNYADYNVADSSKNPLLRKYYLANRNRHVLGTQLSVAVLEATDIDLMFDYGIDRYDASEVGLTDADNINLQLQATTLLTDTIHLSMFGGYELLKSTQVGSKNAVTADWTANNNDSVITLGAGLTLPEIINDVSAGVEYTLSLTRGKTTFDTELLGDDLPDYESTRHRLRLYSRYQFKDNLTIKISYIFESYDETNWQLDNVATDTLPRIITLNQDSPQYIAHLPMVSVAYVFD